MNELISLVQSTASSILDLSAGFGLGLGFFF